MDPIDKVLIIRLFIDVIKKLVSQIDYFTYKGEVYKILDLPMETLYKVSSIIKTP